MKKTIAIKSDEESLKLCGKRDEHIRAVEEQFSVVICARGDKVTVTGSESAVPEAHAFLMQLLRRVRRGEELTEKEFAFADASDGSDEQVVSSARTVGSENAVYTTYKAKNVVPRSDMQKTYVTAAETNDIVFGIGPAGTGKTYLAVAIALSYLMTRKVSRLVLTRPAIEAGESLGFLPGDMHAKINPYLRPLYDALYDMLGFDDVARFLERGIIEIAPLAYMRGRTLNDSFIILDEAQNTTPQQMKMFLTRLGFSSKCIVTGDVTQIDLPQKAVSGLVEVRAILKNIRGIEFVFFSETDVVRHKLVKDIIKAYEKKEKRRDTKAKKKI